MINCKLNRDISLASGTNECMLVDVNVGIQDGLYVFNLEDVKGLVFSGDSRPDTSLFIDTIITNQPYYRVDATSINYTEEYEDHYYTQKLTANLATVRYEIEEMLQQAVHGKYIVAFKVVGNQNYKIIGWKEGLSLDDELTISTEDNAFQLSFTGRTTYPMMEADKTNFDLANKVFEPMFEPLFAVGEVMCADGWAIAKYVVKVNAAGQALDEDNKLCQYSLKKQDAYKLSGVADGNYNIVGTYYSTDSIEGKSVRIYDTALCEVTGSITVNPTAVTLNSTTTSATISVVSSNEWELVTYPSFVEISRTGGGVNDQTVYFYGTEYCGSEALTFRNKITRQTANVTVQNDRIDIGSSYTYPNGTTTVTLTPVLCGTYTATSTEGTVTINDNGSFTVSGISTSSDQKTISVTLVNGTDTKTIEIIIIGNDTTAHARVIGEWCEVD